MLGMTPSRIVSGGAVLALALALVLPASAGAASANTAALQSALTALGLYTGFVDGVRGPLTRSAVIRFQRRRHIAVDGIAGPQTRRALGRRGRPRLGSRVMGVGKRGWDVAALQFLLQRRGFGPGAADGIYGGLTQAAVDARAGVGRHRRRRPRRPGDHPRAARGRQPAAAGQRGPGAFLASRAGSDRRRLRGAARGRPSPPGRWTSRRPTARGSAPRPPVPPSSPPPTTAATATSW